MNAKSESAGFVSETGSPPEDIKALTCDENTDDSDAAKNNTAERTSETPGRGDYEPIYIAPPETAAPHPTTTCAQSIASTYYQSTVEIIIRVSEPEAQLSITKEFASRNNASYNEDDPMTSNSISFRVNKAEYLALSDFLEENFKEVNVSYINAGNIDLLEIVI